jgi:hypothetical protein
MLLSKIGSGFAVGAALVLGASPALAAGGWTIVSVPPTGQNANLSGVGFGGVRRPGRSAGVFRKRP